MKPRQTVKNFHNSNVSSSYQHLNSSTTTSALRDIDLVKLGMNPDDMPNLQANHHPVISNNNPPASQEEIIKCLQAIYGKNSADILQNLPALNDWPMQSVSPPDYTRTVSGSSGSVGSSTACFNTTGGGVGVTTNNNIISSNNPGQQKQDLPFNTTTTNSNNNNNSQQQHSSSSHQTSSTAITPNHFRVSPLNVHSPQLHLSQQKKSVLSLHQHQNDSSVNRRLNHTTSSTSFTNLNNISNASNTSSTSNLSSIEANSLSNSLISGGGSVVNNIINSSKNSSITSNIMDTVGSIDNMFYDNTLQMNKDVSSSSSNQQQTLTRHQQLQKLLKATSSQLRSSAKMSHKSDLQPQQRNSLNNSNNNLPQSSMSSTTSLISSPQTAFTSVPKSLLNLAACSSSTGSNSTSAGSASLPPSSKLSSMVGQLNLRSARNASQSNHLNLNSSITTINNNGRPQNRANTSGIGMVDSYSSQRGAVNSIDQNNMLQHMNISATSTLANNLANSNNNNIGVSTRAGLRQLQMSLLSEDQSQLNRNSNLRVHTSNSHVNPHPHKTFTQTSKSSTGPPTSKEAYLASLQERAARAGVSIGEINKLLPSNNITANMSSNNVVGSLLQSNAISISPNQSKEDIGSVVDRKEIESALSRVEARNDLSLLYPPLLLASNSQRQINALSAGLQTNENTEMFTKEVKRIVLEECNIIYECKECNNLFRSLANLVKHKRTFCPDYTSEKNNMEINKRTFVNSILPDDQLTLNSGVTFVNDSHNNTELSSSMDHDQQKNVSASEKTTPESANTSLFLDMNANTSKGPKKSTNIDDRIKMMRLQARKNDHEAERFHKKNDLNSSSTTQTSLSKLLQSQTKNRPHLSRDSVLVGALSSVPHQVQSGNVTAFNNDTDMNSPSHDLATDQLVQNSSLVKTLLNEKANRQSARQLSQRQSLIELSKIESVPQRTSKRVAPKRKFLEDCIQRVKRDKLLNEGEEDDSNEVQNVAQSSASETKATNLNQATRTMIDYDQASSVVSDNSKVNSQRESDDDDSDMLMIDLDEPKRETTTAKRGRRRLSANTSSSVSPSSIKYNSSSALLKALTRPVDKKASASTSPTKLPEDVKLTAEQSKQEETIKNERVVQKSNIDAEVETSTDLEVLSPLFDRYTCDVCEVDYGNLAAFMDHTIEEHPREKMIYPCIFCSLSFIALENVCRHIIDIHKKPKVQVNRLKEVVRSRSYISSDFSACSDYPLQSSSEMPKVDKKITMPTEQEAIHKESNHTSPTDHKVEPENLDEDPIKNRDRLPANIEVEDRDVTNDESEAESVESEHGSGSELEIDDSEQRSDHRMGEGSEDENNNEDEAESVDLENDDSSSSGSSGSESSSESSSSSSSSRSGSPSSSQSGVDSSSSSPEHESKEEGQSSHQASKQDTQVNSSSSANISTSELTSSGTSAGTGSTTASGGIMKLKIQLKTRPDEKSKVYEIV